MGDVFLEQMVKKLPTVKDNIIKALILLGGISICALCLLGAGLSNQFIGPILFLVAVGAIYYSWYFISGLNLEFEYIYTNGEIDFDKISAKRKRKRITTLRIDSFEVFEQYDHEKYKAQKFDKVIHACSHYLDAGTYCVTFRGKDNQHVLLTFSPNERLLATIKAQYRPRAHSSYNTRATTND